MIKNVEDFKNQYPNLYEEIVNTAQEQERNRIKAIDGLGINGFEDILNKAKYEEIKNAGDCAVEIINAQKTIGVNALKDREKEIIDSKVNDVKGSNVGQGEKYDDKEADDLFNKVQGRSK